MWEISVLVHAERACQGRALGWRGGAWWSGIGCTRMLGGTQPWCLLSHLVSTYLSPNFGHPARVLSAWPFGSIILRYWSVKHARARPLRGGSTEDGRDQAVADLFAMLKGRPYTVCRAASSLGLLLAPDSFPWPAPARGVSAEGPWGERSGGR